MGKRNATEIVDLDQFKHWADTAPKGSWAYYFEGDLASNRLDGVSNPANKLGTYAWHLHGTGQFILAQQRLSQGEGLFRYYIIRRH